MRVTHVITRLTVGGAQENTVASGLGLPEKPGLQLQLISGPSRGPEGSLEYAFDKTPSILAHVESLVRPVHPLKDLMALRSWSSIEPASPGCMKAWPPIATRTMGRASFTGAPT